MNILVVDDEQDVQVLFEQRFRREIKNGEFNFAFAFSGEAALTYLQEHGHEAVLILSDINMPGMSGLEMLTIVKEKFPDIHVSMVSAYGDSENYNKAIKSGAKGFFTKPVDFESLKKEILTLGGGE